jgi:hypothetical protein
VVIEICIKYPGVQLETRDNGTVVTYISDLNQVLTPLCT